MACLMTGGGTESFAVGRSVCCWNRSDVVLVDRGPVAGHEVRVTAGILGVMS